MTTAPTSVTVTFSGNVNPADISATDLVLSGTALNARNSGARDEPDVDRRRHGEVQPDRAVQQLRDTERVTRRRTRSRARQGDGPGRLLRLLGPERGTPITSGGGVRRKFDGWWHDRNRHDGRTARRHGARYAPATGADTQGPAPREEARRGSSPEEAGQAPRRGRQARDQAGTEACDEADAPKHKAVAPKKSKKG